jgi:hypothetical protein
MRIAKNVTAADLFPFALFVTALIIVADVAFAPRLLHQYNSRYYLETTGKILSYEIKHHQEGGGGPANRGGGSSSFNSISVRYSYIVNGLTFESKHYRYFMASSGGQYNFPVYSIGSDVTVFYNPKNPQDAVLDRGLNNEDFGFMEMATVINIIAIFFWSMYVRNAKKKRFS